MGEYRPERPKISPYDREFSQLNHNMFVRYGTGMEKAGLDEFHRGYKTIDVRRDMETRNQKTTALDKHGKQKQRTIDSMRLLSEHGLDNMDWKAWGDLMRPEAKRHLENPSEARKGFTDGTDTFHQLVMTDDDPRYEEYMEHRFGPKIFNEEAVKPPPHKTLNRPQNIDWSSISTALQDLSPVHFINNEPNIPWPREMELDLAPLLHTKRKSYEIWERLFHAAALVHFKDVDYSVHGLGKTHTLSYWSSRTSVNLFVVFLMRKLDNYLENYFYVPCEVAAAAVSE